jgi:serine/threonine-protein kinase
MSVPMSVVVGSRVGAFEVRSLIGRGGMGEVYRALDLTLGREVAVKVLPDSLSRDPERLARFAREARVLAGLNHPNIATVHGFEQADGVPTLVMELVDGPTLADRLAAGAVPTAEALSIARQIADALDAAHEHGVIHRDLKPGNVKIRPDGAVKVLDFGLAKTLDPPSSSSQAVSSPTITSPALTQQGIILGTAAYMAPEQARGRAVDKRADVWAFGCVLYEMLTGRRAFEGDDVTATLAAVIRAEPDWTALPGDVSPTIRVFLTRALEKDPRQRLRDIGDFKLALTGQLDTVPLTAATASATRRWLLPAGVAAGVLAGLLLAFVTDRAPQPVAPAGHAGVARFTIDLLPGRFFGSNVTEPLGITPDGRYIVFTVAPDGFAAGENTVFARPIDRSDAAPVSSGEPVGSLFLAPDSQWIGVNRGLGLGGGLRKHRISGGPSAAILSMPVTLFSGASWGPDGTVVFTFDGGGQGLRMIADTGGTPDVLTTPGPGESHLNPHFLPDGRHVLFVRRRADEPDQIEAVDVSSRERRVVIQGRAPRFAASGHLLFSREDVIWAVAFDPVGVTVRGNPLPVLEGVEMSLTGPAQMGVSSNGTLVYAARRPVVGSDLTWVNRDGSGETLAFERGDYWLPFLDHRVWQHCGA